MTNKSICKAKTDRVRNTRKTHKRENAQGEIGWDDCRRQMRETGNKHMRKGGIYTQQGREDSGTQVQITRAHTQHTTQAHTHPHQEIDITKEWSGSRRDAYKMMASCFIVCRSTTRAPSWVRGMWTLRVWRRASPPTSLVSQVSGVRCEEDASGKKSSWKVLSFVVSYFPLGVYILTKSLIPLLEKSADPRVVRHKLCLFPILTIS